MEQNSTETDSEIEQIIVVTNKDIKNHYLFMFPKIRQSMNKERH